MGGGVQPKWRCELCVYTFFRRWALGCHTTQRCQFDSQCGYLCWDVNWRFQITLREASGCHMTRFWQINAECHDACLQNRYNIPRADEPRDAIWHEAGNPTPNVAMYIIETPTEDSKWSHSLECHMTWVLADWHRALQLVHVTLIQDSTSS